MRKIYQLLLDPSTLPIIESEVKISQTKLDVNLSLIENRMIGNQNEIEALKDALMQWKKEIAYNLQQGNLKYQINYHHKDELGNLIVLLTSTIQILSDQVDEISSSLRAITQRNFAIHITKEYKGDFAPMKSSLNQLSATLNHTLYPIQEASKQQSFTLSELQSGIDHISEIIQLNARTAEESSAISQELAAGAEMLQVLVSQFKINPQE
ncbi:MAG: methyl-accepting chemotaxis protein [Cellulosilyticaceae bacterium]